MSSPPLARSGSHPAAGTEPKCVGCYPAVEKGYQPMCVQNCIGKIRIMGFINPPAKARPDNPIDYLVHVKQMALPYYPQLGLEPNIYYLQGFSGHGVVLAGMAGKLVAEAIAGQAARFDLYARLSHHPFPGGRLLRTPALVLGMLYYRLRDLL